MFIIDSMTSIWILGIFTSLVIVISALIERCFSIFQILFKRPLVPRGAVEIDSNEHIYAHPDCVDRLQDHRQFGAETIYDALLHGLKIARDRPLFTFRQSSDQPFQSYTHKYALGFPFQTLIIRFHFREVSEILKEIGSGVINTGLKPSNETFTGVYGTASVNYALCLYSAWPYSMIPIGIYDSLGREGVKFIIKQTAVQLIFADDLQRVKSLIEWKDEALALRTIVSFVEPTEELIISAKEKKLNLLTLDKLREIGRKNPVEFHPPKPTDTAVIMYTSGSTGEPKGRTEREMNLLKY